MRARLVAIALAVGATIAHVDARADDAKAPAPQLVAPRAIAAGEVPYPRDAHGDATVIVELLVTAEGGVGEARVLEGAEPFASAVREAAMGWTFEPARRGEVRIAGRVRMRIAFREGGRAGESGNGSANGVGSGNGNGNGASAGSGTTMNRNPAPIGGDVRVRGVRRESGQTSLGGSEVRQIPGAFGDPFRAIESLPGVTPMVSGLPFFFVRGAPPGNTGYFIDGVRIPLLYHLGLGPSVVHPGLIQRVQYLFFSSRYGLRARHQVRALAFDGLQHDRILAAQLCHPGRNRNDRAHQRGGLGDGRAPSLQSRTHRGVGARRGVRR